MVPKIRFVAIRTVQVFAALLVGVLPAVASAQTTNDGVFVSAQLGISRLSEEGHAPPLCCNERETWTAVGPRLGARVGYKFTNPFFVQADLAVSSHSVDAPDLTLFIPELAVSAGLRSQGPTSLEFSLGAGAREVSGRNNEADRDFSKTLLDLRLNAGVHRRVSDRLVIGGELTYSKVVIEQNFLMASLVVGWI
jgi:Outer membrane protein beta-barrel domain